MGFSEQWFLHGGGVGIGSDGLDIEASWTFWVLETLLASLLKLGRLAGSMFADGRYAFIEDPCHPRFRRNAVRGTPHCR